MGAEGVVRFWMLWVSIAVGCTGSTPGAAGQGPGPASAPAVQPDLAPAAKQDAAALYAECEARLEQPEADAECAADSDCAPAGCSSERCITKVAAADLMGTCEVLPCFEVVDTCGCSEGRCRWTLK